MGILDIIFLCVFALAAYKGYKNGLLVSLLSLVSLIIAIILAVNYTGPVSEYFIEKYPGNADFIPIVVFVCLLLLVILVITILGRILKKILDLTLLGSLDSIAGAAFGILKWAFFISVLLYGLSFLDVFITEDYAEKSFILPYIAGIAPFVFENFSFIMNLLEPLKNIGKEEEEKFTHLQNLWVSFT